MEYTYLDAINYCISQAGAAPVSSEDDLLPDVQDAKLRLTEASMSLQTLGWWFNTDDTVTLPVDVNGNIPAPTNTIKIVSPYTFSYFTVRGGMLWDHECNTNEFTQDLVVNITTWLDWEDLPLSARDYIRYQAAQHMIINSLEDHKKAASLDPDKTRAMLQLKKDDLEIKQRNMRRAPKFQRVRGGVRPYKSHHRNPARPGG